MGERDHGVIYHAHLRAVPVSDYDLAAFLDQIHDSAGSDLNGFHLLRQSIAEGVAAQGNDDAFFLFHKLPPGINPLSQRR